MTYNEWRDELKSNLLCVSEAERRRVLDYYAEAYADRREAGFSEREIIDDFGAPYDAAQRILNENVDDEPPAKTANAPKAPAAAEQKREEPKHEEPPKTEQSAPPPPAPQPAPKKQSNYGWVFVILCIVFCVPLFGLIMGMIGITIGLCVAPFALVGSGAAALGGSIWLFASGEAANAAITLGGGFAALGAGIILFPLFGKIIKFMWKLFKTVFSAIKNLFTGKEQTV